MATAAEIAASQRKAAKESASRAAGAMKDPRQSSGGGGFEAGTGGGGMPEGRPAERAGMGGMGFSDAEIRQMHRAAGNPTTTKRNFNQEDID